MIQKLQSLQFSKKIIGLLSIVLVLLLFSGSVSILGSGSKYSCEDCNIVYISVDPLAADHMSLYGYDRNTTPNIDRLAENSYVFNRAFSQSSHTTPSLYSTFSSTYLSQHGLTPLTQQSFESNETLLAQLLDRRGYYTFSLNDGGGIKSSVGFGKGFDSYTSISSMRAESYNWDKEYNYIGEKLSNVEGKFFFFYQTHSTHDPYLTSENYSELFGGDAPGFRNSSREKWRNMTSSNSSYDSLKDVYSSYREYYFNKASSNATVRKYIISQYDAKVRRTDAFIGRIITLLKKKGEYKNTIIIINSQHGEQFGQHGKWRHDTSLYNEVIHVPLIIHLPGQERGRTIDQYVENIDMPPTILDLIQGRGSISPKVEEQWQGVSLEPVLKGKNIDKDFILSERYENKAFIDLETKIKYYKKSSDNEFYNLSTDFAERNPLESSNVTQRVRKKFKVFYREIDPISSNITGAWPYFGSSS